MTEKKKRDLASEFAKAHEVLDEIEKAQKEGQYVSLHLQAFIQPTRGAPADVLVKTIGEEEESEVQKLAVLGTLVLLYKEDFASLGKPVLAAALGRQIEHINKLIKSEQARGSTVQ